MSGKSSAVIFIFIVAIGFAANRAEDARGPEASLSGGRSIASVTAAKVKAVRSAKSENDFVHSHDVHKHTHKLSGPFLAAIEMVGDAPEAGDIFVLKGHVTASVDSKGVVFKWVLPEGVELVNGDQEGVIDRIQAGKPFEIQITLRQLIAGNAQVHLQATGELNGGKFGNTAQYNTLLQKSIEEGHKELLKSTEQHAAETQQKIFH